LNPQELFAAHRNDVLRYLARIVGPGDASDLTQEVFLRVSRSTIPSTTTEGERAWVFRIARNLALNHQRDNGRRPAWVELADAARPASQEVSVAMREALGKLTAVDRNVFLLRESAGLSYDEIAISSGLTTDAVRARLRRARLQLRSLLKPLLMSDNTRQVRFHD
jgi:RNA polymerase sigma-70 factor (ECF subfamily)